MLLLILLIEDMLEMGVQFLSLTGVPLGFLIFPLLVLLDVVGRAGELTREEDRKGAVLDGVFDLGVGINLSTSAINFLTLSVLLSADMDLGWSGTSLRDLAG